MKAKSVERLKAEVDAWAAETRLFVAACRRLIEYFGTDKELKSWDAAIEAPLEWVSVVTTSAPASGRRNIPTPPPHGHRPAFRCSESTARIVSPLVEIVGGPVAEFVYTIRKVFPRAEQSGHIRSYGYFSVIFADAVTEPLWKTYRHLAPDEWKACFPPSADRRAAPRKKREPAIDEYLATVSATNRGLLQQLRRTIHSVVPEVQECISYRLPAFRLGERIIAGFSATSKGCSYYPFSGTTLKTLAGDVERYSQTKGALHFGPGRPLPASLVRKLLEARIAEDGRRRPKRRPA